MYRISSHISRCDCQVAAVRWPIANCDRLNACSVVAAVICGRPHPGDDRRAFSARTVDVRDFYISVTVISRCGPSSMFRVCEITTSNRYITWTRYHRRRGVYYRDHLHTFGVVTTIIYRTVGAIDLLRTGVPIIYITLPGYGHIAVAVVRGTYRADVGWRHVIYAFNSRVHRAGDHRVCRVQYLHYRCAVRLIPTIICGYPGHRSANCRSSTLLSQRAEVRPIIR